MWLCGLERLYRISTQKFKNAIRDEVRDMYYSRNIVFHPFSDLFFISGKER